MVEIEPLSGEKSRKAVEKVAAAVNDANGRGECTSSLTLDTPSQPERASPVAETTPMQHTRMYAPRLLGSVFDNRFAATSLALWPSHVVLGRFREHRLSSVVDPPRGYCCGGWDGSG